MDYYASWPRWSVPKWVGVVLGSVFTVIIVGCAVIIVHLVRPATHRAPAAIAAAATVPAKLAPSAPAPSATPLQVPSAVVAAPVADAAKKQPAHAHKRPILAKHDARATRSTKSDLDKLLGL